MSFIYIYMGWFTARSVSISVHFRIVSSGFRHLQSVEAYTHCWLDITARWLLGCLTFGKWARSFYFLRFFFFEKSRKWKIHSSSVDRAISWVPMTKLCDVRFNVNSPKLEKWCHSIGIQHRSTNDWSHIIDHIGSRFDECMWRKSLRGNTHRNRHMNISSNSLVLSVWYLSKYSVRIEVRCICIYIWYCNKAVTCKLFKQHHAKFHMQSGGCSFTKWIILQSTCKMLAVNKCEQMLPMVALYLFNLYSQFVVFGMH